VHSGFESVYKKVSALVNRPETLSYPKDKVEELAKALRDELNYLRADSSQSLEHPRDAAKALANAFMQTWSVGDKDLSYSLFRYVTGDAHWAFSHEDYSSTNMTFYDDLPPLGKEKYREMHERKRGLRVLICPTIQWRKDERKTWEAFAETRWLQL
jgi:hypothetical protein